MKYLLLLFFLVGCAHDFKGGRPNFALKGDLAEQEYAKFHIDSLYENTTYFEDDNFPRYTRTESVKPLIKDVSPKAFEKFEDLNTHVWIHRGLLVSYLAYWFYATSTKNKTDNNLTNFAATSAVLWGQRLWLDFQFDEVAKTYNQDLKQQFAPTLTWNTAF